MTNTELREMLDVADAKGIEVWEVVEQSFRDQHGVCLNCGHEEILIGSNLILKPRPKTYHGKIVR